jgi:hypothetical protein
MISESMCMCVCTYQDNNRNDDEDMRIYYDINFFSIFLIDMSGFMGGYTL